MGGVFTVLLAVAMYPKTGLPTAAFCSLFQRRLCENKPII